jgi:hypothetical protein
MRSYEETCDKLLRTFKQWGLEGKLIALKDHPFEGFENSSEGWRSYCYYYFYDVTEGTAFYELYRQGKLEWVFSENAYTIYRAKIIKYNLAKR